MSSKRNSVMTAVPLKAGNQTLPSFEIYDPKYEETVPKSQYDVTFEGDMTRPGIKQVVAIGKEQYGGALTQQFELYVDPSKATVALNSRVFTFTGNRITPEVIVRVGSAEIAPQYDDYQCYAVRFSDNKDAGTAKAIVEGTCYKSSSKEVEFTILQASMTSTTISGLQVEYPYTGSDVKPNDLTVKLGDVTMSTDDYEISFPGSDYTDFGSKSMTIAGKKNLTSSVAKTYAVIGDLTQAELSDGQVLSMPYDGSQVKPHYSYVLKGKELSRGTHYTETFTDEEPDESKKFIYPGYKSVALSALGYCRNSRSFSYVVYGNLEECVTSGFKNFIDYDGKEHKQDSFNVVFHGKTLLKDRDYTLHFFPSEDYTTVGFKHVRIDSADPAIFTGSLQLEYYIAGESTTLVKFDDGTIVAEEISRPLDKSDIERWTR